MASNLIDSLKKTPLFKLLSQKTIQLIAKQGKEINLSPNDYLFREGDTGRKMYFILRGKLEISRKNSIVAIRKPGEFIGEMALIESKPRSATVKAQVKSTLFEIDQKVFKAYLFSNARVIQEMLRIFSNRAREDLDIYKKEKTKTLPQKNLLRKDSFFFEEASNEFFLVNPSSFKILYANKKACKTLGYKLTEIKSLQFYNLFSKLTLAEIKNLTDPLITEKKRWHFMMAFKLKKMALKFIRHLKFI